MLYFYMLHKTKVFYKVMNKDKCKTSIFNKHLLTYVQYLQVYHSQKIMSMR